MNRRDTFGVTFTTRKIKEKKDGTTPVLCRITLHGKRIEINTRVYVTSGLWAQYQSDVHSRKKNLTTVRDSLRAFEQMVYSRYRELKVDNTIVNAFELKRAISGVATQRLTVLQLAQEFYDHKETKVGSLLDRATLNKYRTTFEYLREFIAAEYQSPDVPLTYINFRMIARFDEFLRCRKNNANNGTVNHLRRLKSMAEYGTQCGYLNKSEFATYKMRIIPKQPVFLEWQELQQIQGKKFEITRLEDVKNLFLFSCYTGLAFIDAQNLKRENLQESADGRLWIITHRKKTDTSVTVPVLLQARAILDYYANDAGCAGKDLLLPRISNQRMNSYLKEIADLCGITKELTSHVGRFTFATTICAANNVPIDTAQKMLGHTKIQTTQHYYRTSRERIGRDMDALQDKLQAIASQHDILNSTKQN